VTQKSDALGAGGSESAAQSRWQSRWPIVVAGAVILGAGIAAAVWFASTKTSKAASLGGRLNVLVSPPRREAPKVGVVTSTEPVPVEQPGALPVQSGAAMCLDAHLDKPAFIYLLWLDSAGQVLPLYPWNNESLEVTDADQPPPQRRTTNLVFSPLIGRSWTIGNQPGLETVLLLTRPTPLPADTKLGSLIALAQREPVFTRPPKNDSPKSEASKKAVTLIKMTRTKTDVSVIDDGKPRGDIVTYTEEPLLSILMHLKPHFDVIHAVQFMHAAGSSAPVNNSSLSPDER
jgi:hypothetical protein